MVTTPYLELDDQATGANDNTWGDVADANFAILELAIARVLGIATTGGTTTLTSAQNRYPIINVTGILASNGIIAVKTQEKNFIVINNTTGAYTLTVKTAAGTGKTIPRGRACKVYCDGTNVLLAREQAIPAAQAGGTADAITATFEPAFIAAEIQDGTMWLVEAGGANTVTNPTFTPDGVGGGYTIKKNGAQALAAGDIPRIGYKCLFAYDASGGHVELLNPTASAVPSAASTTEVLTGTDAAKFVTPDALAALWEKGSNIASAGTISIAEGGLHHITGTTTITDIDFATAKDGRGAWLIFDGALTLTHHSTTLVLPGGANILTEAGDMAYVTQDSADNVKVAFFPIDGEPVVAPATSGITLVAEQASTSGTAITFGSIPAGVKRITVMFDGVSFSAPSIEMALQIGDAGGIETTAYASGRIRVDSTPTTTYQAVANRFNILLTGSGGGGSSLIYGAVTLNRQNSTHTWLATWTMYATNTGGDSPAVQTGTGRKTLSAELTQLQINGGTFDAGSISISYE